MMHLSNDLWWYHIYGENILKGLMPYRDFFPEYPPLSLVFFTIPQLFGTEWFSLVYYLQIVVFLVLGAYLIKKLSGNFWIWIALILSLGSLLWERFDIFPAVFSLLSLYLLIQKRYNYSYLSLSMATLIKFYPLALFPILILYSRKFKSSLFYFLPIFLIFGLILSLGGKEGLLKLISYHTDRGTQPESVKSLKLLKGENIKIFYNDDSKSYEIK